ncbi:MAG TPA: Rieske (2Fe-2S) protein [Actinomycetota bacterium]|nr:Rieske (2Fe-2S) protein [Actinomycetota bacterium]
MTTSEPTGTDVATDRDRLERITSEGIVSRRDYLRILVTISGGLVAGAVAVAAGLFPRRTGTAQPVLIASTLAEGDWVRFAYPTEDDRAIAIRLPGGRLVAYSSICTHLSCAVIPKPDEQVLDCPCHDGRFDATDGSVVHGPPPRPLPVIALEERSDGIYAVGATP